MFATSVASADSDARARCDPPTRSRLRADGFVTFHGLVSPHLIRDARAEITRRLDQGADFHDKGSSDHPAILSLARDSGVAAVLAELLGGDPSFYRVRMEDAQLALRFPGKPISRWSFTLP